MRKHNDLGLPTRFQWLHVFWKYICSRDGWWLILFLIVCFYALNLLCDVSSFNFISFKGTTAETLIDQRSANTATIISMTLAVVGFLIGNVAVKEPFAYQLLFKRSKLYFVIYFTLTTIGTLIVISTVRDSIRNPYYFQKLVVTGTYLVLAVLVMIGYLFGTIIYFTNAKQIWEMLHKELISESKQRIIDNLTISHSKELYRRFIEMHGLKKYDLGEALEGVDLSAIVDSGETIELSMDPPVEGLVKDVDLYGLSAFASKKRGAPKIYYKELALDTLTTEKDNYIWVKGQQNSVTDAAELKKCLVLGKKPVIKSNKKADTVRKHFDEKMEEWAKSNKYRDMEDLLRSYVEIYKMEMDHQLS